MSNGAGKAKRGAIGIFKFLTWIVYALAIVAIIVLAFAFFLLLFGAKPVGFAETIYNIGSDFMNPFKGMITPTTLSSGGVISWSILFAIAAYAVLAWVLGMILSGASRAIYRSRLAEQAPPTPAATTAAVQPPAEAPAAEAGPAPEPAAETPPKVDFAPPSAPEEPSVPKE